MVFYYFCENDVMEAKESYVSSRENPRESSAKGAAPASVPPRFELGLLDSESNVLATRPWNPWANSAQETFNHSQILCLGLQELTFYDSIHQL